MFFELLFKKKENLFCLLGGGEQSRVRARTKRHVMAGFLLLMFE